MATTTEPSSPVTAGTDDQTASPAEPRAKRGAPLPIRTIALGTLGSLLILAGALGAAGILVHDPILGNGPLSFMRYGHGQELASLILYAGFGLVVWAWVRLGRHVLAEDRKSTRLNSRHLV